MAVPKKHTSSRLVKRKRLANITYKYNTLKYKSKNIILNAKTKILF